MEKSLQSQAECYAQNMPVKLFEMINNIMYIHDEQFKPLCRKTGLPQTALSILMFIANNPDYATANNISKIRKIKPSLISFHIDRLVSDGFLIRQDVSGDRRKVFLTCTDKALPIIKQGRDLQWQFGKLMLDGLTMQQLDNLRFCLLQIDENTKKYMDYDN